MLFRHMKVSSTFDAPIIEHFKGIILLSHIHWDITHYFMCKFTSLDTQTEGKNITFDATHINFLWKVLCNKEWPESVHENLCRLHYIEVAGLFGFSLSTNPAPTRESLFKFVFILFCFILPRQGTGPCAPWMPCWGMHRHSCPPVLCGQGCPPPWVIFLGRTGPHTVLLMQSFKIYYLSLKTIIDRPLISAKKIHYKNHNKANRWTPR